MLKKKKTKGWTDRQKDYWNHLLSAGRAENDRAWIQAIYLHVFADSDKEGKKKQVDYCPLYSYNLFEQYS